MTSSGTRPSVPSRHDVVEVIDHHSGYRVTAAVEDVLDDAWVLHFDAPVAVPENAAIHWDDGAGGWQTAARLSSVENTLARFHVAPASEWDAAPLRRSLRARVDNAPILMRLASAGHAKPRLVHAVCLDVSDTGCRVSWPASPPVIGSAVEVAWESSSGVEPSWIRAHVVRAISLPFGKMHAGLRFDLTDAAQAARVRSWVHCWVEARRKAHR
jgi:hypothetical protein